MGLAEQLDRYRAILGIEAAAPSPQHLTRLVTAQIIRVPFENISKLYLRKTQSADFIPSLEAHLEGVERHGFGGTCYATNLYFSQLLRHLGYEVSLCGAAMAQPDVHMVSIVRLDGRELLVDAGYGAPFYEPLPRDLGHDHEVVFGRSRYVLHPRDGGGRSRMDHLRGGERVHGYVVDPAPRAIAHFAAVIRHSYSDAATFMNAVVVERFFPGRSVRIHNLSLTESTSTSAVTTRLTDRDELVEAIVHHCGFPADIVRPAIAEVPLGADFAS